MMQKTTLVPGDLAVMLGQMSALFAAMSDWAQSALETMQGQQPDTLGAGLVLQAADRKKAGSKTDSQSDNKSGSQKSMFSPLFDEIKNGVSTTVTAVKVDFSNLGKSLTNIFKAVAQGIASGIQKFLGGLISNGASSFFSGILGAIFPSKSNASTGCASGPGTLPTLTMAATGGVIEPGKVTLVGEEGPELIVPSAMSTVLTAPQTGRMLARGAGAGGGRSGFASAQVPETKVIINNHSGERAQATRRRGPDGGDIIDVVIGRVAEDMARGGQVADAAAMRFGLYPQGT